MVLVEEIASQDAAKTSSSCSWTRYLVSESMSFFYTVLAVTLARSEHREPPHRSLTLADMVICSFRSDPLPAISHYSLQFRPISMQFFLSLYTIACMTYQLPAVPAATPAKIALPAGVSTKYASTPTTISRDLATALSEAKNGFSGNGAS